MRTYVVDRGPNLGCVIKINQKFLFRGTSHTAFQQHVESGEYYGSNDARYGLSTFVATNIDGAAGNCGCGLDSLPGRVAAIYDNDVVFMNNKGAYHYLGNRPLLLAIAHEKYPLTSPDGEEGLTIPGKISLDDIVIIKTERDLLNVLPLPNNLGAITIQLIKRRAGIFS